MLTLFKTYLTERNLVPNTVRAYCFAVGRFLDRYPEVNKDNLLSYKAELLEKYRVATVNLRLHALNSYLDFLGLGHLKLSNVRVQRRTFTDNVVSNDEYLYFKERLKAEKREPLYFAVWFLTATGVRISELLQIRADHVAQGYIDIFSKGSKQRRVYFPPDLQRQTMAWLRDRHIDSGPIFLNRFGRPISSRGLARQLKTYAEAYGLPTEKVYPHSFRHLFAKNFLSRNSDIVLLADLMGHRNIETTRLYLRRSSAEQRDAVNSIVDW